MRPLSLLLAIAAAVATLPTPWASAAPRGQVYSVSAVYERAGTVHRGVDRLHREAVNAAQRYADRPDDLLARFDDLDLRLQDLAAAADDVVELVLRKQTVTGRRVAQSCLDVVHQYRVAVQAYAGAEIEQQRMAREVVVKGGTADQVTDTLEGQPRLAFQQDVELQRDRAAAYIGRLCPTN